MSNYMRDLAKVAGNEYGMLVDDGIFGGEVSQYIDTGSYVFNALLSGSIYGGLPANKITAIAGESATGKTFFTLGIIKHFLDMNPTAGCIYFESESALTSDMLRERGIDTTRVYHMPVATVEEFRHQAVKILEKHGELKESERPPLMLCLDSLGMLSTIKEMKDVSEDNQKRDMTKAQVIKGTFRVLTLMLAKVNVPFIVTNHVYDQIGSLYPVKVMGGGCLVDGTNIQMADGSLKNISEIEVGDDVMTMDGNHSVLQTHAFDDKELYEIEFEDGYVIKCSADHKFLVDEEWIRAEDIFKDNIVEVDVV